MKLQAKDLMIGDWVMVYPWDETPWKSKKITDINFHSWEGVDFCDSVGVEGWDELSLDQIKPIPLTAEMLKKNGWIYEDSLWLHDDAITLQEGFDGTNLFFWFVAGSPFLPINYVHELQHVLKLCGIEKQIELC